MENQLELTLPYFYLSRYIDSICEKFKIDNYTVNEDGTVDVDGDVELSDKGLKKLPLKFGRVTGHFFCDKNQLSNLEGSPNYVGGGYHCHYNKLTTLEGAPNEVGGDFYCHVNNLVTLEGSPSRVGGGYYCYNNSLINLEGAPKEVGYRFVCNNNPIWEVWRLFPDWKSFMDSLDWEYLRGEDIVRVRFQEALDELNIEMPNSINGWNYI